ncbi:MAG: hypothetical protein ACJ71Z_13285 [Aeromicrobium sp.]
MPHEFVDIDVEEEPDFWAHVAGHGVWLFERAEEDFGSITYAFIKYLGRCTADQLRDEMDLSEDLHLAVGLNVLLRDDRIVRTYGLLELDEDPDETYYSVAVEPEPQ